MKISTMGLLASLFVIRLTEKSLLKVLVVVLVCPVSLVVLLDVFVSVVLEPFVLFVVSVLLVVLVPFVVLALSVTVELGLKKSNSLTGHPSLMQNPFSYTLDEPQKLI
jgi:hypothetical protein